MVVVLAGPIRHPLRRERVFPRGAQKRRRRVAVWVLRAVAAREADGQGLHLDVRPLVAMSISPPSVPSPLTSTNQRVAAQLITDYRKKGLEDLVPSLQDGGARDGMGFGGRSWEEVPNLRARCGSDRRRVVSMCCILCGACTIVAAAASLVYVLSIFLCPRGAIEHLLLEFGVHSAPRPGVWKPCVDQSLQADVGR